jgi:autotransporter-associated beta strand protein
MKTLLPTRGALLAICLGAPAVATADTIYSGLQDTTIPTDFTGVFLTVDGGAINPFFGGVGVANDNLFQPVRSGTGNLDTIQNLAVGSTVDVSKWFASGYGGSQDHLGATFIAGEEGYLGFKTGNDNYGWMRVVFTGNSSGAVVRDWAYDNSGAAMVVGRIQQSAPSAGTQLVTLSPGTGESFTLGSAISDTGGNINSVLKTGGGATTVTNASYTGSTTVNQGRLVLKDTTGFAGSGITVNSGTIELHRSSSNWNISAAMSGSGAIEKTGSGDVTVTGASASFDGNVTISSGGFFVNGSFGSASCTISVGSGATFGGSGSTDASVTVSGILAPGPSIESLATGDLTMTAGSTFAWGVGADHNADMVQVTGLLSLAGVDLGLDAATLDNLGLNSWATGDRLTLFSYNGSGITSGFNGYNDDAAYTFGGNQWRINYNDTIAGSNFTPQATGSNFVTMTVVPEPQAALVGGLGMMLLLRRRRKN